MQKTDNEKNPWESVWNNLADRNNEERENLLYNIKNSVRFKHISFLINHYFKDKKIKILEFGSGEGIDSILLSSQTNPITLFDYSHTALNNAKKLLNLKKITNYQLIEGNCFNYKNKIDSKFDLVMSNGTAEHFRNQERINYIKNMYDLTEKGGLTIISTPYKYNLTHAIYQFLALKFKTWIIPKEFNFSKQEYKEILKKLNIKVNYEFIFGSFYDSLIYNIIWPFKYLIERLFQKSNTADNFYTKKRIEKDSIFDEILGATITLVIFKN